ncbi:hypothetical protein, partial [Sphingobacterium multivorum]|uniref:hypothetical protein n=1 Tax=Sphingobacterium multivorum TaxID=28454 RepID=UPI003DA46721
LDFPSLNHVINKANFFCLFHTLNITKINKKQIKNLNINKIKTKHFCNGLDKIKYQYSTYGNSLDILIKDGDNSMIIDAKYKLQYRSNLVHQDIRQVAGYSRLNKVRKELDIDDDRNIACLIIYPYFEKTREIKLLADRIIVNSTALDAYYNVFKLGLSILK